MNKCVPQQCSRKFCLLNRCVCVFQVTACLRERGRDGCLSGIQVQQLFCSQNTSIPEHQLKELNAKIDNALQVNTHLHNSLLLVL